MNLSDWFKEDRGLYTSPLTVLSINEYEKLLGSKFSESYRNFLINYGSGIVGSFYIYGNQANNFMDGYMKSVVDKTNFYKITQQWPGIEDWYIISDDGRGNPIGCKPDGSVWLSDHDADFEQVKLADDFEEFLEKILDDRLYD
ncbi:MAG: hypothetical protein HEEMFOPI_01984 [Holosporales bacterium]